MIGNSTIYTTQSTKGHDLAIISTKWHLKERSKQKNPPKPKKMIQEVVMWFLLCSHSMILITKLRKKEVSPERL